MSKNPVVDNSFKSGGGSKSMMKRIISLALCLLMIVSVFAGCAKKEEDEIVEEDKGAYITMYITDPVYNFDPAQAYGNESALRIVSLMFDNLFVLDDNGKVQNSLAKNYKIYENDETNEYKMTITLRKTLWSDKTTVSANDVVYAWKRILDPANSFGAAALLYDIKNAREAKEGDVSIDAVCMYAPNDETVEIYFNGKIDYKRFVRNLTSYALAPLREDIVLQAADPIDWAKNPTIMAASGPFKLREISFTEESAGLILERNVHYYRDYMKDKLQKSVTPYRLIVDYTKTPEELLQGYNDGSIFYVGNIPLSIRQSVKDQAEITDALSTHTYVLNHNADIAKADGSTAKLFADVKVRNAMSKAIDRDAIANQIVFARAATGLVPYGVFDENSKKDLFRENGGALIATTAAMDEAKALLAEAGIKASDYSFSISVAAYDDVHMEIAKMVQAAWGASGLGFKVELNAINVIPNEDISTTTKARIPGIMDDIFAQEFSAGNFEVAAIDYTAYSADAFSVLAPFAKHYTGNAYTVAEIATGKILSEGVPTHISGYDSEEFNTKIDEAFKANTDTKLRTTRLHEAEQKLVEEMPVIPIIFNQNATLIRKDLSKYDFTYYGSPLFAKMKLKNHELHVPTDAQ